MHHKAITKDNLLKHTQSVHEKIKDSACNMCDFKTFARRDLQRHVDGVHLGKQTWPKKLAKKRTSHVCNTCDKKFPDNKLLHVDHKNILIPCY